ncbi:MAG: thioredoxin domain-containing protein [Verrucomicrobia bacterium]|nr:thioredoxin domain-containing protein [Verrucomicrobiota bacterium]
MSQKANALAGEVSPYLLQHAHNPVDWMPWGEAVWRKAKEDNKPVFLSIGYSTCHWCHVMERESFESEAVAEMLNRDFVPVKVDREERPDVDRVYMTAVQAMTGQGGWPLSVWVTPDGKPFYGGTYFPPTGGHGRPGFLDALRQISAAWRERREEVGAWAEELAARIRQLGEGSARGTLGNTETILAEGTDALAMEYDRKHGGFGGAPKFPRPSQPLFLLRRSTAKGGERLLEMVRHTGRAMRAGGIYDQIGDGFHRYAVDGAWAVPHFEKMLYDNGQLMGFYAELAAATGERWAREVVEGIDRYLQRDLALPGGGLASAEDADSEGVEGKFYVWTRGEVRKTASNEEFRLAEGIWGVTEEGNFMDPHHPARGWNVLARKRWAQGEEAGLLESLRAKLEKKRGERVRPGKDDKVLTSWNALAISGYARAARWGGKRCDADRAVEILGFLEGNLMRGDGTPSHRWRDGQRDDLHLLEDYAGLLQALVDLQQATLEPAYLIRAEGLAEKMLERFGDPQGGGLWSGTDTSLIARMKDDYDGAEPSGNATAALALIELGRLTDQPRWSEEAAKILDWLGERMKRLPQAVPHALIALQRFSEPHGRLILAGEGWEKLQVAAGQVYRPDLLITRATKEHPSEFVRRLADAKKATAYLCEGQSCQLPLREERELIQKLRVKSREVGP